MVERIKAGESKELHQKIEDAVVIAKEGEASDEELEAVAGGAGYVLNGLKGSSLIRTNRRIKTGGR